MKSSFRFCLILIFVFISFVSCSSELQLEVKENGALKIDFKGGAGTYISKMIQSTSEGDEVFDVAAIKSELEKAGLKAVNVSANKTDIQISMEDEKKSSYLFSSGLINVDGKKIQINITPENLVKLYNSADQQLVILLDLFLAPVFNDEQMSVQEYLEVLASFYGDGMATEVKESFVKITLVTTEKKLVSKTIPMTQILCLSENILLHSSNI